MRRSSVMLGAICCLTVATVGCKSRSDVTVFHAASLRRVLADAAQEFEKKFPAYRVRLEPSGSQVAARKLSELNMRADVIAVADASVIDRMLVPTHASWNLVFATNEVVLAHMQHSPHTDVVDASNWPAILLNADVRLGCVNPDLAPLGYHTVFAWMLAEKAGGLGEDNANLTKRLRERCAATNPSADETELLGLLEARAVDYAFLYRSTAEDHRLKFVALPAEINLSRRDLAGAYSTVQFEVQMKKQGEKTVLKGQPITYGMTIPAKAPNQAGGEQFLLFLLGPEGQAISRKAGFKPLSPSACVSGCDQVPGTLSRVVTR